MITLVVTYVVREGCERDAEALFRELIAATRREPGCRTCDVNRADDAPRTFLIYERYADEASLEAHRASEHFQRYARNGLRALAESRTAQRYTPFS